jgi:hypothetical protein
VLQWHTSSCVAKRRREKGSTGIRSGTARPFPLWRRPIWKSLGMGAEYHLIDLTYGVSHGGFRSLEAARQYAREECLIAWDIFHGNVRVESSPEQLAFTALHRHLNTRRFRSRLNV